MLDTLTKATFHLCQNWNMLLVHQVFVLKYKSYAVVMGASQRISSTCIYSKCFTQTIGK